ncbi:hypothetical protein, partial [Lactobacillus nasalidis]
DTLLAAYAGYSWYCQAKVVMRARWRMTAVIMPILLVWLGATSWGYSDMGTPGFIVFLALFILTGILEATSGLADKRVVLSGYFRRTLKYSEIKQVILTAAPPSVGDLSIAALETSRNQVYYLRFNKQAGEVTSFLMQRLERGVNIDVRKMG